MLRWIFAWILFNSVFIVNAAKPTVPASNIIVSAITCNTAQIRWTSGNGGARMVVLRKNAVVNSFPIDGGYYSANNTFGSGDLLGFGNYVVFNSAGGMLTVTGLEQGSVYHIAIFEHDNSGNYLTSVFPASSFTTLDLKMDFEAVYTDSCLKKNFFTFKNKTISNSGAHTYRWDFGDGVNVNDSNTTYIYPISGAFTVKLTANPSLGCTNTISKNVRVIPKVNFNIAINDIDQCIHGNEFVFTNSSSFAPMTGASQNYRWYYTDGDSSKLRSPKKKFTTPGVFNVSHYTEIFFNGIPTGCRDTTYFQLEVYPNPVSQLGVNDSVQCLNKNKFDFTNPDVSNVSYQWNLGDGNTINGKDITYTYADVGNYSVIHSAQSIYGCVGQDTIGVRVLPSLNPSFTGLDTFYCSTTTPVSLVPAVPDGVFEGSSVSGSSFYPQFPGNYSVRYIVTDPYCSDTSEVKVRVAQTPDARLGNDTAICNATQFTIRNLQPEQKLWSDGSNANQMNVTQTGNYWLTLFNDKCFDTDTVNIQFSVPPIVNLGRDTSICKGRVLKLTATAPNATYLWHDGSRDSVYYTKSSGVYKVIATNPCGVTRDSISISILDDYCDFYIANAFSPDGNKRNEIFKPVGPNFEVITFSIYNRWGELIYIEKGPDINGWDGKLNGVEVPSNEMYVWILEYQVRNSDIITLGNAKGFVYLFR